jgi:hypothetical protein
MCRRFHPPFERYRVLVHHARKGIRTDTMKQMQIQKYHQEHRLIPEQKPHEHNPLFQLLYDTQTQLGNTRN